MSGLTKGHIGHKYVQYVPIASAPPGSPLIMNAVIWFGSMQLQCHVIIYWNNKYNILGPLPWIHA